MHRLTRLAEASAKRSNTRLIVVAHSGNSPGWLRATAKFVRQLAVAARDDRIGGLAAEVAFFAVLGIFPGLLAVAAALGSLDAVLGDDLAGRAEQRVVDVLNTFLTDRAKGAVEAVRSLFRHRSGGVLSFGMAAAMWAASRGMAGVLRALTEIYDVEERRSVARTRLVALVLAIGSLVAMALILSMLVLGPLLGGGRDLARSLGIGELYVALWEWLSIPVAFLVLAAWAGVVLHSAPHRHTTWRREAAGAIVTAALWLVVSIAFRLYLALFGGNEVFGVLGGALVILLWVYLLSFALLVGGEVNATLARPSTSGQPRAVGDR